MVTTAKLSEHQTKRCQSSTNSTMVAQDVLISVLDSNNESINNNDLSQNNSYHPIEVSIEEPFSQSEENADNVIRSLNEGSIVSHPQEFTECESTFHEGQAYPCSGYFCSSCPDIFRWKEPPTQEVPSIAKVAEDEGFQFVEEEREEEEIPDDPHFGDYEGQTLRELIRQYGLKEVNPALLIKKGWPPEFSRAYAKCAQRNVATEVRKKYARIKFLPHKERQYVRKGENATHWEMRVPDCGPNWTRLNRPSLFDPSISTFRMRSWLISEAMYLKKGLAPYQYVTGNFAAQAIINGDCQAASRRARQALFQMARVFVDTYRPVHTEFHARPFVTLCERFIRVGTEFCVFPQDLDEYAYLFARHQNSFRWAKAYLSGDPRANYDRIQFVIDNKVVVDHKNFWKNHCNRVRFDEPIAVEHQLGLNITVGMNHNHNINFLPQLEEALGPDKGRLFVKYVAFAAAALTSSDFKNFVSVVTAFVASTPYLYTKFVNLLDRLDAVIERQGALEWIQSICSETRTRLVMFMTEIGIWSLISLVSDTLVLSLKNVISEIAKGIQKAILKTTAAALATELCKFCLDKFLRLKECYSLGSLAPLFGDNWSPEVWVRDAIVMEEYYTMLTSSNPMPTAQEALRKLVEADKVPARFGRIQTPSQFTLTMDDHLKKGETLLSFYSEFPTVKALLQRTYDRFHRFASQKAVQAGRCGSRVQPYFLFFHGPAGVGKTTLIDTVRDNLARIHGYPTTSDGVYVWQPNANFQDGFTHAQWAVSLDDIDHMNPAPGQRAAAHEVVALVNSAPFPIQQADIADKGRYECTATFVSLTSNFEFFRADAQHAYCSAPLRRVSLRVRVEAKPEFSNDGKGVDLSKLGALHIREACNFYITRYKGSKSFNARDMFTEERQVSFSELSRIVIAEYKSHLAKEQQRLAAKTLTGPYCLDCGSASGCSCRLDLTGVMSEEETTTPPPTVPPVIGDHVHIEHQVGEEQNGFPVEEHSVAVQVSRCDLSGNILGLSVLLFFPSNRQALTDSLNAEYPNCDYFILVGGVRHPYRECDLKEGTIIEAVPYDPPENESIWWNVFIWLFFVFSPFRILTRIARFQNQKIQAAQRALQAMYPKVVEAARSLQELRQAVSRDTKAFLVKYAKMIGLIGVVALILKGAHIYLQSYLESSAPPVDEVKQSRVANSTGVQDSSWIRLDQERPMNVFTKSNGKSLNNLLQMLRQAHLALTTIVDGKEYTSSGYVVSSDHFIATTHCCKIGSKVRFVQLGMTSEVTITAFNVKPIASNPEFCLVRSPNVCKGTSIMSLLVEAVDQSVINYDSAYLVGETQEVAPHPQVVVTRGTRILTTGLQTKFGDCGRIYVCEFNGLWYPVAMHYAILTFRSGSDDLRVSAGALMSALEIKRTMASMGDIHAESSVIKQCFSKEECILELTDYSPKSTIWAAVSQLDRQVYPIGRLDPPLSFSSMSSKIKRSIIADYFLDLEEEFCGKQGYWTIPKFSGKMIERNGKQAWFDAYSNAFETQVQSEPDHLFYVAALKDYLMGIDSLMTSGYSPMSDTEVLVGVRGSWIGPVNMDTSVGPPFNQGKRFHVTLDVYNQQAFISPEIHAIWMEIRACLQRGEIPCVVGVWSPKDEPTKDGKLERIFIVYPTAYNFELKKYLGPLQCFMRANFEFFESAVGIDMTSSEVNRVVNFLKSVDPTLTQLYDLDVKAMDKSYNAHTFYYVDRVWYGIASAVYTPEHAQYVYRVTSMERHMIHCAKNDLFRTTHHGSGQQDTVEKNGFTTSLSARYMYYRAHGLPEPADDLQEYFVNFFKNPIPKVDPRYTFRRDNALATYGDDLLGALRHPLSVNYQEVFLKELGMIVTPADKTSQLSDFKKISDVDFLKRRFLWDPELESYKAPLSEKSIVRMLVIKRDTTLSDLDAACVSMSEALKEAMYHGPEFYERLKTKALQVREDLQLQNNPNLVIREYAEVYQMIKEGKFRTWTVRERVSPLELTPTETVLQGGFVISYPGPPAHCQDRKATLREIADSTVFLFTQAIWANDYPALVSIFVAPLVEETWKRAFFTFPLMLHLYELNYRVGLLGNNFALGAAFSFLPGMLHSLVAILPWEEAVFTHFLYNTFVRTHFFSVNLLPPLVSYLMENELVAVTPLAFLAGYCLFPDFQRQCAAAIRSKRRFYLPSRYLGKSKNKNKNKPQQHMNTQNDSVNSPIEGEHVTKAGPALETTGFANCQATPSPQTFVPPQPLPVQDPRDLLTALTYIRTDTFTSAMTVGDQINFDPLAAFLANTQIERRLYSYLYMQAEFTIVGVFTIPGSSYGGLAVTAVPMGDTSDAATVVSEDLRYVNHAQPDIYTILDATNPETFSLELPWIHKHNYSAIRVADGVTCGFDWRVYVHVVAPLTPVFPGTTTVGTIRWYVRMKPGYQLVGRILQGKLKKAADSVLKDVAPGLHDKISDGKGSRFLNGVASTAGMLTSVPVVGAAASAVETVASVGANVLSFFGFSRTIRSDQTFPLMQSVHGLSMAVDATDMGTVGSLFSSNTLSIATNSLGEENEDELHFKMFCARPFLLDQDTWTSASSGHLPNVWISPMVFQQLAPGLVQLSPAGYAGLLFNYWRGTCVITIKCFASRFHTGVLQIYWMPESYVPGADPTNSCCSTFMDISETREVTLEIGFVSNAPMLRTDPIRVGTDPSSPGAVNGQLLINIVSPLSSPGSTPVEVVKYVYWKDIEFGLPRGAATFSEVEYDLYKDITYQSGCSLVTPTEEPEIDSMYMGERIVSLRPLAQKPSIIIQRSSAMDYIYPVGYGVPIAGSATFYFTWARHCVIPFLGFSASERFKTVGSGSAFIGASKVYAPGAASLVLSGTLPPASSLVKSTVSELQVPYSQTEKYILGRASYPNYGKPATRLTASIWGGTTTSFLRPYYSFAPDLKVFKFRQIPLILFDPLRAGGNPL